LIYGTLIFRHLRRPQTTSLKRSALLRTGPLARRTQARFACGVLGGLLMPGLLLRLVTEASPSSEAVIAASALLFVACLAGELLERYLFFAAVASLRMPGALQS